jgi:hypothetical protein
LHFKRVRERVDGGWTEGERRWTEGERRWTEGERRWTEGERETALTHPLNFKR